MRARRRFSMIGLFDCKKERERERDEISYKVHLTSCSEEAACGFNWTRSAVAVNVAVSVAVAVNVVDAIDVAFNSGWGPILAAARALFIMRSCTRAAQNSLAVLINYDKQRAKAAKNKTLNQVQQQQGRRGKFEDAEKKIVLRNYFYALRPNLVHEVSRADAFFTAKKEADDRSQLHHHHAPNGSRHEWAAAPLSNFGWHS